MALFPRLRAANVPWLHHLAFLASLFLLPPEQIRPAFLIHALVTFFLDTEHILKALQDPAEPPLIPHPWLPFLGHTLGMFWYGASYFSIANHHTQHPIYTLQTLNARTIVVISPHLAAPIQRASKNTSFYGMILEVTKRLVGFDAASMDIIKFNLDNCLGTGEGIMEESGHMVAAELSPGPSLTQLSSIQLDKFSEQLNGLTASGSPPWEGSLMAFVKAQFTTANAYTIYGPLNPFAVHPELVQSFWDYEAGMIAVMADVFPWVTARKPWKARQAINDALQEFIEKEHYKSASPMIQKRVAINLKHGLTTKMAGRAELILLFGIIGNAVPTVFWFLANVFARPELLRAIREETSQAVLCARSGDSSKREKTINIAALKTQCPLLVSTYRETLRSIANLSSVRLVTHTHTITAPSYPAYLLRKGSLVQIASGVIHHLRSVWGPDAGEFKPERFTSTSTSSEQFLTETAGVGQVQGPAEKTATALPKNVPSAAFRAFGGGSVICPGRHFAQSEILGFVALCIHMLDVVGLDGQTMPLPERDNQRIPLSVMKPKVEPIVRIRRREGEEDAVWRLEL